ncbi:alpha/beta hydrolase [Pseudomonas cichorii]|uniref:alpha/beta fold hydrolase n=1 Tax=Pseudomonas cichorii TaxID=36746 RepID=UPI0018E657B6|nr:alpha/beta hydrolase [Pseudomonas cichorii]MBI6852775.1 alpha/beta hydrolase [Pseudomonas cichorii]
MRSLFASAILYFTFGATLNAASAQTQAVGSTAPGPSSSASQPDIEWRNVRTQFISAGGVYYAYREFGQDQGGTPVVFLNHLAAVLDNWDPRVLDGIAAKNHIVAFDNRGVGASTGEPAASIEQMADDAVSFIKAKGFTQVDLFGFSMGGMIAQEIVLKKPKLVRKIILAGTGPAGGEGISTVAGVSNRALIRGLLTGKDPKQFLFFTRTANGIAAGKAFLERLKERSEKRDDEITFSAYRAQLKALHAWGEKPRADLSVVKQPVLIANGEDDLMVPIENSRDLALRLPHSELLIYPDAGHAGIFQFYSDFVPAALKFLDR